MTFKEVEDADCVALASAMRWEDVRECRDVGNLEPLQALRVSSASARPAIIAYRGATPICMFGISSYGTRIGHPWLLGSPEIERLPLTFLRASRKWLEILERPFYMLHNVADARNEVHLRWLRWLGFDLSEPAPLFRCDVVALSRIVPCASLSPP